MVSNLSVSFLNLTWNSVHPLLSQVSGALGRFLETGSFKMLKTDSAEYPPYKKGGGSGSQGRPGVGTECSTWTNGEINRRSASDKMFHVKHLATTAGF